MKIWFVTGLIFIFILSGIFAEEGISQEQINQGIAEAEAMRDEITTECRANPYECSCQQIPCNDILEAEHERAQEVYDKCIEKRDKCEAQRKEAIEKIEKLKNEIELDCRKNLNSCDCSKVEDENGKKECELAILNAKHQAEKEKNKKILECVKDLENCDCSSIENEDGKKECEEKLGEALQLKNKIQTACEKNAGVCSCDEVESAEGKVQCEEAKEKARDEAGKEVIKYLEKCFKNVDECDCASLGLPEQEYVDFCEVQKNYGISCRDEGLYCEELETMPMVPYGLPDFMAPLFERTYKSLIEKEKSKGAKKGAEIMSKCIRDPENCNCSLAPTYAIEFCEHKKELQIKCLNDDYEACLILEDEPNLPEGFPKFARGMFEQIAEGLRKAQEGIAKGRAAKKIGNMILECMDDESKCDCSMAPKGEWKSFCEHKKKLVKKCMKKHYDSCFILDEEPLVSEDMPDFIKKYVNNELAPEVEIKKQTIYDEMKVDTACENIPTIPECKVVLG